MDNHFLINPIGVIRSELVRPEDAPKQGDEGNVSALIEVFPGSGEGLNGLLAGDEILLLTWFHLAQRDVLKIHPRGNKNNPVTGVFSTRSPHRPNPLGLHRVTIVEVNGNILKVTPLEAVDGTPVVDIKPVLGPIEER